MSGGRTASAPPLRRRGALDQWSLHFGPNMTPMVDVVMVILVFFMCSAAFVGPEWFLRSLVPVKAPPPKANTGTGAKDPLAMPPLRIDIALSVGPDKKAVFSSAMMNVTGVKLSELGDRLAAFTKNTHPSEEHVEMLIKADLDVLYADVVSAHEMAAKAGILRVSTPVAE